MPKTVIISSSEDPAGQNIRQRLIENFAFRETNLEFNSTPVFRLGDILLVNSEKEIVSVGQELDSFSSDLDASYVFISRHRAESGIPSLTAHFTGNFGSPEFGGRAREIAHYSPSMLKNYMKTVTSLGKVPSNYEVTLEATHHGPTELKRPLMFVELGSTSKEWPDEVAASSIAEALIGSLEKKDKFGDKAIALGGTHYPDKFNEILLESDMALGTVVPKYALDHLDADLLSQILSKSTEKITAAALDMKGLGKNKGKVIELVTNAGLEILKT